MLIKYRVHEVAKDFGLQSKEIVELLKKYFPTAKKSMTALEEEELDVIFDYLTQNNQVESFDEYFAEGEKVREESKKAKEKEKADMLAKQQEIANMMKAAKQTKSANKPSEKSAAKADITGAADDDIGNDIVIEKSDDVPKEHPNRGPAKIRTVDTRAAQVELDKYNEKYEEIASQRITKDNGVHKQKIGRKQGSKKQYGSKRETEADKRIYDRLAEQGDISDMTVGGYWLSDDGSYVYREVEHSYQDMEYYRGPAGGRQGNIFYHISLYLRGKMDTLDMMINYDKIMKG